jgi:hypothetical protein
MSLAAADLPGVEVQSSPNPSLCGAIIIDCYTISHPALQWLQMFEQFLGLLSGEIVL